MENCGSCSLATALQTDADGDPHLWVDSQELSTTDWLVIGGGITF